MVPREESPWCDVNNNTERMAANLTVLGSDPSVINRQCLDCLFYQLQTSRSLNGNSVIASPMVDYFTICAKLSHQKPGHNITAIVNHSSKCFHPPVLFQQNTSLGKKDEGIK